MRYLILIALVACGGSADCPDPDVNTYSYSWNLVGGTRAGDDPAVCPMGTERGRVYYATDDLAEPVIPAEMDGEWVTRFEAAGATRFEGACMDGLVVGTMEVWFTGCDVVPREGLRCTEPPECIIEVTHGLLLPSE